MSKLAGYGISPVRTGGPPPMVLNYNCPLALSTGTLAETRALSHLRD